MTFKLPVVGAVGLMIAIQAGAQDIHKCVDADGNISFSDQPCADASAERSVSIRTGPGSAGDREYPTLESMISAGPLRALSQATPLLEEARDHANACRIHVADQFDLNHPACGQTRLAHEYVNRYADFTDMLVRGELDVDPAQRPEIDRIGLQNRRIVDQFNQAMVFINDNAR